VPPGLLLGSTLLSCELLLDGLASAAFYDKNVNDVEEDSRLWGFYVFSPKFVEEMRFYDIRGNGSIGSRDGLCNYRFLDIGEEIISSSIIEFILDYCCCYDYSVEQVNI